MAKKPSKALKITKRILIAILIVAILFGCLALFRGCGANGWLDWIPDGWFDWLPDWWPGLFGRREKENPNPDNKDPDNTDPDKVDPDKPKPVTVYTVRFENRIENANGIIEIQVIDEIQVAENTAIGDQMPEDPVVMGTYKTCPFSSGWYSNNGDQKLQITRDTIVTSDLIAEPDWTSAEYHKYVLVRMEGVDSYGHACILYKCSRCGYEYTVRTATACAMSAISLKSITVKPNTAVQSMNIKMRTGTGSVIPVIDSALSIKKATRNILLGTRTVTKSAMNVRSRNTIMEPLISCSILTRTETVCAIYARSRISKKK